MIALLSVFVLAASTITPPPGLFTPALSANAPAERAQLDGGVIATTVWCTADCGPYADVTCSGTVCNAVDRSCQAEPGHVTCDGNTFYCAACTVECTEGTFKTVTTGPTCSCEDGQSTPKDRYKCIGGEWVYQFSFCGGPFCPAYP